MRSLPCLVICGFLLMTALVNVRSEEGAVDTVHAADAAVAVDAANLAEDDMIAEMTTNLADMLVHDAATGGHEHDEHGEHNDHVGDNHVNLHEELRDIENSIGEIDADDAPSMSNIEQIRRGLDNLLLNTLERLQDGFALLMNTFYSTNYNHRDYNHRDLLRRNRPILFEEEDESEILDQLAAFGLLAANHEDHEDDDYYGFNSDEDDYNEYDEDADDRGNDGDTIHFVDASEEDHDFLKDPKDADAGKEEHTVAESKVQLPEAQKPQLNWTINLVTAAKAL